MYISKILFFLLLIGVFFGFQNADPVSSVKIMTYNIRLDFAGDAADNWQHRRADMVKYVREEQPDFFCIQEGLHLQVKFLAKNLKDYKYIGAARDDGKKAGEYCAIFYRKESWKVKKEENFWLSETPEKPSLGWDAACFRVATLGIFERVKGGVGSLAVLNTHFDHVGVQARAESVELLNRKIAALQKDYATVLTGDFNLTPDTDLYAGLNEKLTDAYTLTENVTEAHPGTFNGFKMKGDFARRIDYVFLDAEKMSVQSYRTEVPVTVEGRQLSDHFPVIVRIIFYNLR